MRPRTPRRPAARSRLNPGGLFTLWFHQYEQSDEAVELVLRTLHASFPHVTLFQTHGFADVIAVASVAPIAPDFGRMQQRLSEPAVREDLARIGVASLVSFLTHHGIPPERLAAAIPVGPINSAVHQRLEYMAPRSFFEQARSRLLNELDPLLDESRTSTQTLLDRYIAYRASAGDPIGEEELREAARYVMSSLAKEESRARAITRRALRAPRAN